MILYRTPTGAVVEHATECFSLPDDWDALLNADDLAGTLATAIARRQTVPRPTTLLSPVRSQEVWAAGVTYWRSRTARMEESKEAGGGSFYDRVYDAERPELFPKATPHRVAAPGAPLRLRRDSKWMVPEPELALVVNAGARIVGYTIGNDLSCRDIEGENPLYLPQAKVWDGCAALGPGILVTNDPLPKETEIRLSIMRGAREVAQGTTNVGQIRRTFPSLVEFLYREASFPTGCFLMTGTGIVPADDFTLAAGDEIHITVRPIGTLSNTVI